MGKVSLFHCNKIFKPPQLNYSSPERERYNQIQARKAARKAKLDAEYAKAEMGKRGGPPGTRPSNAPIPASDLQPPVSIEQDEFASEPDIAIYVRSATMEN